MQRENSTHISIQEFIQKMEEYDIEPYDEFSRKGLIRHIFIRKAFATGQLQVCLVSTERRLPHINELLDKLNDIKSVWVSSDPGLLVKKNNDNWIQIISSGKNINKMCPYCMADQGKFSKHCFLCHKCIEIFDHHCHWINNCVGHLNKPYFIGFIISLLITLCIDSSICIYILVMQSNSHGNKYYMDNIYFRIIYCSVVLMFTLFFVFPVSYLLYMQFKNKDSQKEVQTYYKEVRELTEDKNLIENDKTEKLLP